MMNKSRVVLMALMLWAVTGGTGFAAKLVTANVASSYKSCYMVDNGDGTSRAMVDIAFNSTTDALAGNTFSSRGVLFYSYDKDGKGNNSKAISVAMNDSSTTLNYKGEGYIIYYKSNNLPWTNKSPFVTTVSVQFQNSVLADWPAVGIRAGNYTNWDDVGEVAGAAYISVGDSSGVCRVVSNPDSPPPPNILISVNAPDWNLGEIEHGVQNISFTDTTDQLCLKYSDAIVANKSFIITATNENGVVNQQYQLNNLSDGSQVIPYKLLLDNGNQQVTLPNGSQTSLTLSKGGQTCFVPTFTTYAPKSIKKGDYSDVLTFNIVTKT